MERQGLIDPASLEIFVTWYSFSGPQRGISPMEAMSMPSWLRRDFQYLLGELGKAKKRAKKNAKPRSKS